MAELEQHSTESDAPYAGLLNGVMVILLGLGVAGVMAWQIIAELSGWLPNLKDLTIDAPSTSTGEVDIGALFFLVVGFNFAFFGVRLVHQNLAQLRARPPGPGER